MLLSIIATQYQSVQSVPTHDARAKMMYRDSQIDIHSLGSNVHGDLYPAMPVLSVFSDYPAKFVF